MPTSTLTKKRNKTLPKRLNFYTIQSTHNTQKKEQTVSGIAFDSLQTMSELFPNYALGTTIRCFLGDLDDPRVRVSSLHRTQLTMAVLCFTSICRVLVAWLVRGPRARRRHQPVEQPAEELADPAIVWVSSEVVLVGAEGWRTALGTSGRSFECPYLQQSLDALEGDWSNVECPLCYSTLADKSEAAWWPCGHVVCAECAVNVFGTDLRTDESSSQGFRCPQCRERVPLSVIKRFTRLMTV